MARTEPEMGNNDPPSRPMPTEGCSIGPRVAAGEPRARNPRDMDTRSAADGDGISSAVRIRGSVLELAGKVKGRPVKVLIDSGATGNFISDHIVTALDLAVMPEAQHEELTLADGSVVKAAGFVQFWLRCGEYNGRITARVFLIYARRSFWEPHGW